MTETAEPTSITAQSAGRESDAGPRPVHVVNLSSGVPIGVIGFGFSIITLGLFNTGIVDAGAFPFFPFVAMFCGATAMMFGGIWEARSANVFGATFGMAYACFLVTTGVLVQFVQPQIAGASGQEAFNHGFAAWLLVWTIFTALLAIGAWYVNLPAFLAFVLLAVVYLLAAFANLAHGDLSTVLTRTAGWLSLLDGIAAWYLGIGILLNAISGRTMWTMPLLGRACTA